MSIIPKYFLNDPYNQKENLPEHYVDVFIISEELHLVDSLCHMLSKELNSCIHWYTSGNVSVICVMEKHLVTAIKTGKRIIIENFNSMSAEFICEKVKKPVFEDYSIISTFNTTDIDMINWYKKIDPQLIIKVDSEGKQCILTKTPYMFRSKITSLKLDYISQLF